MTTITTTTTNYYYSIVFTIYRQKRPKLIVPSPAAVFHPCVFCPCVFHPCVFHPCVFHPCVFRPCVFHPCVFRPCVFHPCVFRPCVPPLCSAPVCSAPVFHPCVFRALCVPPPVCSTPVCSTPVYSYACVHFCVSFSLKVWFDVNIYLATWFVTVLLTNNPLKISLEINTVKQNLLMVLPCIGYNGRWGTQHERFRAHSVPFGLRI